MLLGFPRQLRVNQSGTMSLGLRGQTRDFESAIRGELPVLYRVAKRMASSTADAEDLVQETLLRAFAAWNRFDGRHVRAWLMKILYNENLARFRSREPDFQLSEFEADEPFQDDLWVSVANREQAQVILSELEKLESHHRLAIQLCDVEGMSYEEVADILEVPIGTVRSRICRGRNLLRERVLHRLGGSIE